MKHKRPNLLFVMCDQLRRQAIGFMNADPVYTPNLDRFAEESLVLTDVVSNRPICSPYRGMLFTGKYPFSNGILTNCNSKSAKYDNYLKSTDITFSDILKDNGYENGYIGKCHLDAPKEKNYKYTTGPRGDHGVAWDSFTPPESRHGFNFWHAYGCRDKHFAPHYWEEGSVEKRIDVAEWSVKHEVDTAINFLSNKNDNYRESSKPFSLFVSHNPPHTPFEEVPQKYRKFYADKDYTELLNRPNVNTEGDGKEARDAVKDYFAAITGIDEQFGRLMTTLEEEGLEDNTIVIFTSDHGEMMGSQGLMHKGFPYEESLLVPLLIRWPGHIESGQNDILLSIPDIMPTLLGLMNIERPSSLDIEGEDYSPILLGEEKEKPVSALYLKTVPWDTDHGTRGVRTQQYTFEVDRENNQNEIHYTLYDNTHDPFQQENIAEKNPELISVLEKELINWLRKTGDPWYNKYYDTMNA